MIRRSLPTRPSLGGVLRAAARRRLPCALKLDSAAVGETMLVACEPVRVVRGDSVAALAAAWAEERASWNDGPAGMPIGVGFLSYDLGRSFNPKLGSAPLNRATPSPWPLVEFRFYEAFLALGGTPPQATVWARTEAAAARLIEQLREDEAAPNEPALGDLVELEPPAQHLAAVARALEYIRAGDIYQVNLARRLAAPLPRAAGTAPGAALLLGLEHATPAPYAFWLADGETGTALVGNSPERFLRVSVDGVVETCPIKGTRPRGPGAAAELVASAKDRAEHVMIVDLERNDLGRVCQTGSVVVAELGRVLALPTVCHLESTVRGRLRADVDLDTLLRATFPGGSVTGAPKLRAMEIIDELEPAWRGPYTGATGWLGAAGDLDLALAIRTALVRDAQLTLWVGGGIVADSTPEGELAETWDKARAFSRR